MAQCDGNRPSCGHCARKRDTCIYKAQRDETRFAAWKRGQAENNHENTELREFLLSLRSRSESESLTIFHRLRTEADLSTVLAQVRDSDLLLGAFSRQSGKSGEEGELAEKLEEANTTRTSGSKSRPTGSFHHESARSGTHDSQEPRSLNSSALEKNLKEAGAADTVLMKEKQHKAARNMLVRVEELYHCIRSVPEAEVVGIIQRIQSSDNPLSVLELVQGGDDLTYPPSSLDPEDEEDDDE